MIPNPLFYVEWQPLIIYPGIASSTRLQSLSIVMLQSLQPSSFVSPYISCTYTNRSRSIQIIRLEPARSCAFERVILPQQSIVFEAEPEDCLEIYTAEFVTTMLADRIVCNRLSS